MHIADIRVASQVLAYTSGAKTTPIIAARLEIVGILSQGHRNCMKARLKNRNDREKRRWLIAFHGGTVWIGHSRTKVDKKITHADLKEVGGLLGLCLNSSHEEVSVSPDPDLSLPPNILFQDPDPNKGPLTITAPEAPRRATIYRAPGETRHRSHP